MSFSRRPTLQQRSQLSIVVVGGGLALLGAVRQAALEMTTAQVVPTDLAGAANAVSEKRPFALVVAQGIHSLDAPEFSALARDVGARLIVAPERLTEDRLVALLVPELTEALKTAF